MKPLMFFAIMSTTRSLWAWA